MPDFKGLTDFCHTFKLFGGKNENGDEDPTVVGEFKVASVQYMQHLLNQWKNTETYEIELLRQISSASLFGLRVHSRCTLCQMTRVFLLLHSSSESCQTVDPRSVWSGFMWSEA